MQTFANVWQASMFSAIRSSVGSSSAIVLSLKANRDQKNVIPSGLMMNAWTPSVVEEKLLEK